MHILFATPAFPPFMGGGENHAGSLARNLVERGHRVTVLTSLALSEADLWNGCGQVVELEKTGPDLTVIRVPIRPMPAAFRGLLAWRSSMVRLSTLPGTVSLLLKMAQRMPALAGLDEALSYIENPVNSVALNSAMRHQRHMLSCADMLITNTSKEASGLQAYGVKPNLVRVAGVGVDIPDFVAGPLPGADYPKPYVLFIGRISYDKGAIHAAQAVLRLREQGSDIKLVLIGRDTEEFRHYHGGLSRSDQDAILAAGCVEESIKHACLN